MADDNLVSRLISLFGGAAAPPPGDPLALAVRGLPELPATVADPRRAQPVFGGESLQPDGWFLTQQIANAERRRQLEELAGAIPGVPVTPQTPLRDLFTLSDRPPFPAYRREWAPPPGENWRAEHAPPPPWAGYRNEWAR